MSDIDITPTTYNQSLKSFKNQLNDIEINFNISVNALLKSYPEYKLYPDVSELENIHNNNLYNLQDVKQKFFLLQTNLNNSNEKLKDIINIKNEELEKLKIDNKKLNKRYNSMSESDQSSIGLRAQFEDEYRQKYVSLVLLMSFTLLASFIGVKYINTLRQIPIPK